MEYNEAIVDAFYGESGGGDEVSAVGASYGGYGGGNYGGYSGGDMPWLEFGPPEVTELEKGFAWFRLVTSSFFLVFGTWSLICFYQSRYVLDIRTRSAYLVLLTGVSILSTFVTAINEACLDIWDSSVRWFWSSLVLFFVLPIYSGSYISRGVRLAVVFNPRVKHALPWLIPERNHFTFLLLSGIAFMALPMYYEFGSNLEVWEIIDVEVRIFENISVGFAVVLTALYPFIRNVDDMFKISTEIIMVIFLLVCVAGTGKVSAAYASEYVAKLISVNIYCVVASMSFLVSIMEPIWRLTFDPHAASKRDYANRVILSRKGRRSSDVHSSSMTRVSEAETSSIIDVPEAESSVWTLEQVASTPMLAAAFENFARRAMCQESVMFLNAVSRYQDGDFECLDSEGRCQFEDFSSITKTYICSGAREEINISSRDKKIIVGFLEGGKELFDRLPTEEKRLVFYQAYKEVYLMLEANLLLRFMETKEFLLVKTQRESLTAMMDSPSDAVI